MSEDKETKVSAILVSDGDKDSLYWKIVNLLKQTFFKKGKLEILIFVKSADEFEFIQKIKKILLDPKITIFLITEIENSQKNLTNYLQNTSVEFFYFFFEKLSLRPDALELFYTFLVDNLNLDGAYSDFVISFNNDEYEITDSKFVTKLPNDLKSFPRSSKLLPSILVLRKKVLLEYFQELSLSIGISLLNFFNFILSRNFNIEKIDAILGSKHFKIDFAEKNHIFDSPLREKLIFEEIHKIFGKNFVRLLSFSELTTLPYHLSNQFNDLVTVVVNRKPDENELEYRRTIDSLQFQNHKNIEILVCFCDQNDGVVARNLVFLISNGKYVFTLNTGDEIFPNALTNSINRIKDTNSIGYVYFDYYLEDGQKIVKHLDFSDEKLKRFNFIPCYVLILRSFFLKGYLLDETLPMDYALWDLWLNLAKKGIGGLRISEPLLKVNRICSLIKTNELTLNLKIRAKIVLKHKELFSDMQIEWANSVLSDSNLFDNSKIPAGIIPNNVLLTKIVRYKSENEEMKRKKKVLFVMYGWNESGGGTIFPKNVAIELSSRGWEVSVFYASLKFDPTKPPYSLEISKQGEVTLYGLYNRPAPFNDPENPSRETSDQEVERKFLDILDRVEPDIIHIHNLHGLCLSLPKIAKERSNVPIVFTPHNYFLIDPKLYLINSDLTLWSNTDFFKNSELAVKFPDKRELYRKRQNLSIQLLQEYFDLVLAVSKRQKEILAEFSGRDDNIIVVHQANKVVDELWNNERLKWEAERPVPKKVRFGYIGGVIPTKGVHNLVLAAQQFLPNDVEFHIYGFVGQKYAEQLNSLDKRRIIKFHQEYSLEDLEEIASEIDVGVVPSIYEDPAPLVLLELNAMRLPVLGAKIGGIPDFIVDGVNGFLFEANEIDSLVSAIRFCSFNPDVIQQIRKSLVPVHSFQQYISHIESIYNALISGRKQNLNEFELVVTKKLHSLPQIADVKFTRTSYLPDDMRRAFQNLGFELIEIQTEQESKNYVIYQAKFKVPKEVTIEEFFQELKKESFEETLVKEDDSRQIPLEFDKSGKEEVTEKVFGLDDLEEIVLGKERTETTSNFQSSVSEEFVQAPKNYEPELNVVWEGSQFVYHSLALINREHCSNLIDTNLVEVTIVPYEAEQFQPVGNPKYEKLAKKDIRIKEEPPEWVKKLPYLWVRHQWPPKAEPPKGAKWVIIQPWEFTVLPKRFVEIFLQADELWVPSNYTRLAFINSGIPFNKVQIVPNGIDPWLFQPNGKKYPLQTNKKLKFLYVGGTTYRKGFEVLLQSFVSAFTAKDDVALVVKDMGTESFYRGQTAEELIDKIKNTPNAPEIIYIKDYLTEEEIASLYRACDVFVSPYRGEGFSLPTLEAMASGLPVIVTEGGATEDFVLDTFAWKIPSYKISIGNMIDNDPLVGEAFILEPDGDYLTGLLKSIYLNPADITVRGVLASSYARTYWTWKRSTLKLLSRIDALYGKELSKKAKDVLVDRIDVQIMLGLAEEHFANGELAEAYRIYREIEPRLNELNNKYKVFYYLRCAIINILRNDFDSALRNLNKVEEYDKDNIDVDYLRSKILYLQNNLVEALESYTKLVSRWNSERFNSMIGNSLDQILVEMGNILMDMNDVDSALQLFTNALKLNERKVEAYIGSAKCFIKVNDFEEARRMLEWGLKIEPENEEAKRLLDELLVTK